MPRGLEDLSSFRSGEAAVCLTKDSQEGAGWRRVMRFTSGLAEFDKLIGPPE